MSSCSKLYIYDLAINFAAQVFVLFAGVISLVFNGLLCCLYKLVQFRIS